MQAVLAASIKELAVTMCKAPGPAQAISASAQACTQQCGDIVYIGLAVLSHDKQTLQYTALHSSRPQAARLGAIATSSAAAGIAVETKQTVHVRDINLGDLRLQDLQYLRHEHNARTFIITPVVIAQTAWGALGLGASTASAFAGMEQFVEVVAAMCAPYLIMIRSQQELLALEGLLAQMMPVRVALQLRHQTIQLQQQQQQLRRGIVPEATGGSGWGIEPLESRSSDDDVLEGLPPLQVSATAVQPARFAAQRAAAASTSTATDHAAQPQRQRPGHQSSTQQQNVGQAVGGIAPHKQQQQQQRVMSVTLSFQQLQLETAYRTAVSMQWQQSLDVLFLLLSLISTLSTRSAQAGWAGLAVSSSVMCAVLSMLALLAYKCIAGMPTQQYVYIRQPAIATVRILRALLLCVDVWSAPARAFSKHGTAKGLAHHWSGFMSPAEMSGCGVLLMLGLTGQLPLVMHAAVQFVCAVMVCGELRSAAAYHVGAALQPQGADDVGLWFQAVIGWLLPVAVAGIVEWRSRVAFLYKIR